MASSAWKSDLSSVDRYEIISKMYVNYLLHFLSLFIKQWLLTLNSSHSSESLPSHDMSEAITIEQAAYDNSTSRVYHP